MENALVCSFLVQIKAIEIVLSLTGINKVKQVKQKRNELW